MAALSSNYTDYTVLIYDTNGVHLRTTVVTSYDKQAQRIQVRRMPSNLNVNDDCKLLILSSPSPCEYLGKVRKEGAALYIAMFQGQEKESRGATRYAVDTPGLIDALVCDNNPYPLHSPVKVVLINVSTTGMRFRAPYYCLTVGDVFKMHLVVSGSEKQLLAKIVNYSDKEQESSDYGCRFIEVK
jgi:hypothetical protein